MIRKNRKNTGCVKYDEGAIESICANPKAEPFWVADMDFESPKAVNDAVRKASSLGLYGYATNKAVVPVVQQFLKKVHDLELEASQIVPSCGVLFSLSLLTEAIDGAVIVPTPAYKPFITIPTLHNRKIKRWPLAYDENSHEFHLDFERLEELCSEEDTRLLIFCSPQNPSGLVFTEQELLKVALICRNHCVKVICDEIHSDLVYPGIKHFPFVSISRKVGLDSVTLMAPSKTFNLAGEHFSLTLFSNPADADIFRRRTEQLFISSPSYLDALMAMAAYQDGYQWLMDCRSTLQSNIAFVDAFLKERIPSLHVVMPHASFICFIDGSEILPMVEKDVKDHPKLYKTDSSPEACALSRFLGVRCKVACNAGTWFGPEYCNFVRFNFATDRKYIENALLRIEAGVAKLQDIYGKNSFASM